MKQTSNLRALPCVNPESCCNKQMTVKLLPIFTFLLRHNSYICEGGKTIKIGTNQQL